MPEELNIDKAFILAGGLGTRLRPITMELSKLILPVQGKPCLQWNIELAKRFGVQDITLAVGHLHEQIEEKFGDGEKLGVKLHYNLEEKYMGTAGALKIAEGHLKGEKIFIGMNGDELKDIDFAAMAKVHEKNKAIATLAILFGSSIGVRKSPPPPLPPPFLPTILLFSIILNVNFQLTKWDDKIWCCRFLYIPSP